MRKFYVLIILLVSAFTVSAQYSLTVTTYSQDFNGLGTATASPAGGNLSVINTSLDGWYFSESGTGANTTITAGTGSSGTGDTYNFGAAAGADRILGGLQSGSLIPTFGFYFTNNTGGTITDLAISYTGETWRVGTATRSDRIDFQYSTDATSLTTGTWTDADALDYANPGQATGSGSLQHSSAISATLSGLSIANGATFFIRWNDANATGADDGMGVNNFSFTATLAPVNTITTGTVSTPPFVLANCAATASGTVDFTATDVFGAGNIFTAQLSDDIGSFSSPANIGSLSLSGTNPSGTINITIPAGTVSGSGYLIRVISDNPAVTGTSSSAFTITQQGIGGCASSHTDYYRSVQTGNWGTLATWESSPDNTNWIAATLVPSSLANTITIQNGHTVTIVANASADQLTIQNGATLNHSSGTFTIQDGTGNDVDVQNGAVLQLTSASNPPTMGVGSPVILVNSGATVRVAATGLTGASAGVNLTNYAWDNNAILDYTLTSPFSTSGVTYFPSATVTIPIFKANNASGITVGAAANTVFNGIFESAGGGVTWQSAGTKTFRNGIRGSGPMTATTSGKWIINGTTAELGGSGSLTAPATGLEIGSGTTVTVTSNKTVTGDIALLANTYVDLGANNLTVTGVITGGSSTSYIRTSGTGVLTLPAIDNVTPETFPIGVTSYNPLVIGNGSGSDFSARVANGINNPSGAIPTDAVQRTWYINASVVTPGVNVTYQYNLAECVNAAATQPTNMEILQSDYTTWHLIAGNTSILSVGADPYTVAGTGMAIPATSTPYTLGTTGTIILAVDYFISARAQKQSNHAVISWNVSNVDNVNSFEIQRAVGNGTYQSIGTVSTAAGQLQYQFTDLAAAAGTNLYRIRVNRTAGGARYSNIVAVIIGSKGLLLTGVTPNPAQSNANITLSAAAKGRVTFEVYNMTGVPVRKWISAVAEGTNIIPLQTADLPAGIYNLVATGDESRSVMRFVKQ